MKPDFQAKAKLWPGEAGTKQYVAQYGKQLVCVRYLYEATRSRRYTTVELIVQEGPWRPRPRSRATPVGIQVQWGEAEVAARIKKAGGTWDRDLKVWRLPYAEALALGLADRLVRLPVQPNATQSGGPRRAAASLSTNG